MRGRNVSEAKVRQVGFFTAGSEPVAGGGEGATVPAASSTVANSPAPVIIPPQSMKVMSPRRLPAQAVEAGSYSAEPLLAASPSPAPSSRSNSNGFSPAGEAVNVSAGLAGKAASASDKSELSPKTVTPAEDSSKSLKERTSKAERRALQDAQRAQKAARAETGRGSAALAHKEGKATPAASQKKDAASGNRKAGGGSDKKAVAPEKVVAEKKLPSRMQFDDPQRVAKLRKKAFAEQAETKNRLPLFRHLPHFVHGDKLPLLEAKYFQEDVMHPHPSVYKIGLQYLTEDVVGGNVRSVALLCAFRDLIQEYSTPPEKTLVRDLTARMNSHVSFLIECRPLSISMGNAIKFLKTRIGKLSDTLTESEAKALLIGEIDRFLQEKIVFADQEIVRHAVTKIRDGDVLLTYAFSSVVEMILVRAHQLGKKFRVVVVDSRPKLEGRRLLCKLLEQGLQCTYCQINTVTYIMQEVTRVFLGAASVLSNGTVYSRVGTACVAMVASSCNIPVLICCETYKFHERVQLDSICSNELGDPDVLVKVQGRKDLKQLEGWQDLEHLQLLNLKYDATPAEYVTMVITELGMLPPTSVAVILREYRKESSLIA